MSAISLHNLRKSYGQTEVVHGIDLDIEDGQFVVFVGPSGCGKSTLLKLIAGLEDISGGDIRIAGQSVRHVPPARRGLAMVFQSYALYPHMTVRNNIAFGLKMARLERQEIDRRVNEAARILQLDHLLDRYPRQLSGGQRQRVAIGRAVARKPRVLLFDEPLSNLDAELRGQTRVEIAKLHKTLRSTIIYVTHDQVEAMTLADRIVLLNGGRIEQVGSPLDLYHRPDNLFVARFIGSPGINLLPAARLGLKGVETVGLRPEHIGVLPESASSTLGGTVDLVEHLGDVTIAYVDTAEGDRLVVKTDPASNVTAGDTVSLTWNDANLLFFDVDGKRIEREEAHPAFAGAQG